jgi:dTDP-4-amino-4,6-dideoxygalactose transaminase
MKELAQINYELREGFIPEKLYYVSPINDYRLYIKRFPHGFMSLPNAERIIERMMIRAKLERMLQRDTKTATPRSRRR